MEQVVDFIASERHYLDHLYPIWENLPEGYKGDFYTAKKNIPYAKSFIKSVKDIRERNKPRIVLVASFGDLVKSRSIRGTKSILAQHGAGQIYKGSSSNSYIGSPDARNVIASLIPGVENYQAHKEAHPTIPVYQIGIPKLDYIHKDLKSYNKEVDKKTIAFSFHWDCQIVSEAGSAFSHYKIELPGVIDNLKKAGYTILGHGHPRDWDKYKAFWEGVEVEPVKDFSEVINRAWLYVCDNSSTMFEWCSLDRPLVVLNCPKYSRKNNHGMRFWDYADMGVQCEHKKELEEKIRLAIKPNDAQSARRKEITEMVYKHHSGESSEAASKAIIEIIKAWRSKS